MRIHVFVTPLLLSSLTVGPLVGCSNLPGSGKTQGAVIGGAGGAIAGAAIGRRNPLLGALIGGALGAGGGYLIGAHVDKTRDPDRYHDEAVRASRDAEARPARASDVTRDSRSQTADLNNDGYVTMDEVVAMRKAGLSDSEMIRRLQDTNQVFDLTPSQEQYLREQGVDRRVIDAMLNMGRDNARGATYREDPRDSRYDPSNDRISR